MAQTRARGRGSRSPGPSAPHAEQRRGLRRGSRCGSGQSACTPTGRATAALGTRPRQPHSSTQRGSCGLSTLPGLAVQRLLWLCELCNGDDDKSSTASGRTSRVRGGAPPGGPEACGRRAVGGGGGWLSGPWSSLPSAQPAVHKHKRMNAVRRPVYQYIWLILAAVTGNPATRLHPKGRPLRCTTRQSRTLAPGSQTRRPLRWGETRTRPPPHSALTGPFTAAFFPSCCLPAPGSRGWGRAGATAGTGSGLSSWMVAHQQNQNVSHTGSTLDKSGRPTGGRSSDHQVAAVGWAVPGPGTARPNASDKTKPAVGRGWTVRAEKD